MGLGMKQGRDELVHYYYAQAAYNKSDEYWRNYGATTFDHLRETQKKDGSWPTSEGLGVGPVYSTALWCTIMQLETNNHPSIRRDNRIE